MTGTIAIVAYGQPKPKGSLRHVGNGRMVEQLVGAKPWREAIKFAALAKRPECMITGPVMVWAWITVAKPASAPKRRRTWPITRSSGDIDKHARNILDALVDAAIMRDDSQVVELRMIKTYPDECDGALGQPGAYIEIIPVE